MAHSGLRYFAQLRSKYKGDFWRVEIAERDYSGPSEEMEFAGGSPLGITWENRGDEFYASSRAVDHLLLFCLGGGPVSGAAPMIRKHTPLGGYMDRFLVDCQPAQDRGLALRIAAGSLNKERGVKCSSHDGSY